ncbi:hypothetical protein K0U07_06095 [bacterium]|nr:hypothetical protein [bacterium]
MAAASGAEAGQVNYRALLDQIYGLRANVGGVQSAALQKVRVPERRRGNDPQREIVIFADNLFRRFVRGARPGDAKKFYDNGTKKLMSAVYGKGRHKNRAKQQKRERDTPIKCVGAFVDNLRAYRELEIPRGLKDLEVVKRYIKVVPEIKGGCIDGSVVVNLTQVLELAEKEVGDRIVQRQEQQQAELQRAAAQRAAEESLMQEQFEEIKAEVLFDFGKVISFIKQMFGSVARCNQFLNEIHRSMAGGMMTYSIGDVPKISEGKISRRNFFSKDTCVNLYTSFGMNFDRHGLNSDMGMHMVFYSSLHGFFAKRCSSYHLVWEGYGTGAELLITEGGPVVNLRGKMTPKKQLEFVDFSDFPQLASVFERISGCNLYLKVVAEAKVLEEEYIHKLPKVALKALLLEIRGYITSDRHFFACSFVSTIEYCVRGEMERRGMAVGSEAAGGSGGGGGGAAAAAGHEE